MALKTISEVVILTNIQIVVGGVAGAQYGAGGAGEGGGGAAAAPAGPVRRRHRAPPAPSVQGSRATGTAHPCSRGPRSGQCRWEAGLQPSVNGPFTKTVRHVCRASIDT